MKQLYLAFAAPLLLAAAPATLDEETKKDLRCFVVMSNEGREKRDQERATHPNSAARFFLERVSRRAPQLDIDGLTQALAAEAATNGNRPIGDFVPGCIDERMRAL